MKKLLIAFCFLSFSIKSQDRPHLYRNVWHIGESYDIFSNRVTRLEGETKYAVTNVAYKSFEYNLKEAKETAEKEMWTPEDLAKRLDALGKYSKGGAIYLHIKRLTIDAANTEFFTIIVKDTNEVELFRKQLKNKIASVPIGDNLWRNSSVTMMTSDLPKVFFVYVIDKLRADDISRYKFKIEY